MSLTGTIVLCVTTLAMASSAWAQAGPPDRAAAPAQTPADHDRALAAMASATTSAPGAAAQFAPIVSLEGTTKDKVVTAQLGIAYRALVITAGLSGAVDGGGDPTTFADLNGLRDKTTASVNVTWHTWPQSNDTTALQQACRLYAGLTRDDTQKDCAYLQIKRATRARVRDGSLTEADGRRILRALDDIAIAPLFYFGAGGDLSPETFSFVSADTLAPGRETHTSWSAHASGGVLFGSGWLVAGRFTREVAFHGGSASQICQPLGSTGALSCAQKTIGAPGAAQSTNQIGAEVRKQFGAGFAVSPRFTYDKHKNAVAVAAPIYFIRSPDGGLDGGVTFGWRSDTRAFTVSAFVGAVLGLITK